MWLLTGLACSLFSRILLLSGTLPAVFPMLLVSISPCCSWYQRQKNVLSLRAQVVWCACALLPHCRHTWVLPLLPWVLCGWVPGAGPSCVPGASLQHPGGSSPEVGAQALPCCQQEPEPGRDVPSVRARCDFGSDVGQEWLPRLCPSTGEGWELPTENR